MAYVSYDDVSRFKGFKSTDNKELVEELIDRAADWLDRECQRPVVAEADSIRYIDAVGDHINGLELRLWDLGPLCAITTLTNGDGVVVAANEYTTYPKTLTAQEPVFRKIKILPSSNKYWTYTASGDWENSISIDGRWALFTEATVPASVTHLVIRLALYMLTTRDTDAFETVVIPEAGLVQAPVGFPVDAARIVRTLRRT